MAVGRRKGGVTSSACAGVLCAHKEGGEDLEDGEVEDGHPVAQVGHARLQLEDSENFEKFDQAQDTYETRGACEATHVAGCDVHVRDVVDDGRAVAAAEEEGEAEVDGRGRDDIDEEPRAEILACNRPKAGREAHLGGVTVHARGVHSGEPVEHEVAYEAYVDDRLDPPQRVGAKLLYIE